MRPTGRKGVRVHTCMCTGACACTWLYVHVHGCMHACVYFLALLCGPIV